MYNLNITAMNSMTSSGAISYVNQQVTIPSLVILFISALLIFSIVGIMMLKQSSSRNRYFGIVAVAGIVLALVLALLMICPNLIAMIVNNMSNLVP